MSAEPLTQSIMNTETRKLLNLPPMPVNANCYRVAKVPVCGIAAVCAFCCVVGMVFGFIIALIAQ